MIRLNSLPWFYQQEISEHVCPKMAAHIKAKRLKPLQKIITFDGSGKTALCELINLNKIKLISTKQKKRSHNIILALPYCDIKTMNNIIIKATELGCSKIDIIHTEYSYSCGSHKRINQKNLDKWQIQMQQACQQAENPFMPIINYNIELKNHLTSYHNTQKYVLGFDKNPEQIKPNNEAVLYVGPEGGFSQAEAELFKESNTICLSFGQNILKVETATISGLALLLMSC